MLARFLALGQVENERKEGVIDFPLRFYFSFLMFCFAFCYAFCYDGHVSSSNFSFFWYMVWLGGFFSRSLMDRITRDGQDRSYEAMP